MTRDRVTQASVEAYLRDHVRLCRDLLDGGKSQVTILDLAEHRAALVDRHGESAFDRIHDRATALTREIFGGEAAPPLADARRDHWSVVEADYAAEKLAKEARANNVRPCTDRDWKKKVNAKYAHMWNEFEAEFKRRAEQLEHRATAPQPAPADTEPPLKWRGLWGGSFKYRRGDTVTHRGTLWFALKEVSGSASPDADTDAWQPMHMMLEEGETRSSVADREDLREVVRREVAAWHRTMHKGVWKEGQRYEQGQLVTHGGSTWSVQRDGAAGKPGESGDFLLVVKKGTDGRK